MEEDLTKRILFEDDYLAIVYKYCGEDSQLFFKNLFKHRKYAQVLNRLDKPVSGLLIISFSKKIQTTMNELFKQKKIQKEYWAICKKVESVKINTKEYCENFVGFNSKNKKAFVCENGEKTENYKKAALFYELAGFGTNYNFLRIFPITGRTHQIRLQLAHLGMPIKGDIKYGSKRTEKNGGIRLHSYSIEFIHPITDELVKISCFPMNIDALWKACSQACLKINYEKTKINW